jgi:hypothetical protein
MVKDKKWSVKETAISILNDFAEYIPKSKIGEVFDLLFANADDKNPQVRIASISAITQLVSKNKEFTAQAIIVLINKIEDKGVGVKETTLKAIPLLVDNVLEPNISEIFSLLFALVEHQDSKVRTLSLHAIARLGANSQKFKFLAIAAEYKFAAKALSSLTVPLNEKFTINDELVDLLINNIERGPYDHDQYNQIKALEILINHIPVRKMIAVIDFLMFVIQEGKYIARDAIKLMRNLSNNELAIDALSTHLASSNALVRKYAENALLVINSKEEEVSDLGNALSKSNNHTSQTKADSLGRSDIELAKQKSLEDAKKQKAIGPRELPEFGLQDVDDSGNCFYLAIADQMQLINHLHVRNIPEGTESSDSLRLAVQRENFRDREWAEDSTFDSFVTEFPDVILAIIDTRNPERGFTCYYIDEDGTVTTNNGDMEIELPDRPIIRLAATGNHFLSVRVHPQLDAGAITNAYIQPKHLEVSAESGEHKENDDKSAFSPNELIVGNMMTIYNNPFLNHQTLLVQTYKLAGIEVVNYLLELGEDKDVAEQILYSVNELGLDKTLEILFKKSTNLHHDSEILKIIDQIEVIVGKEALSEIIGFYQYISIALSNNPLSGSAAKAMQTMSNLVNILEEWLDFSSAYESVEADDQVAIILAQLENWIDFVASGITYVGLSPRYPDFDPDYDFGGSGGSSEENGCSYSSDQNGVSLFLPFAGNTTTIQDFSS